MVVRRVSLGPYSSESGDTLATERASGGADADGWFATIWIVRASPAARSHSPDPRAVSAGSHRRHCIGSAPLPCEFSRAPLAASRRPASVETPQVPDIASGGRSRKVGRGQRRRPDDRRGASTGTSARDRIRASAGAELSITSATNRIPRLDDPPRHRFDRLGSARRTDASATDGHRSRGTPALAGPGSLPGPSRQPPALRRAAIAWG